MTVSSAPNGDADRSSADGNDLVPLADAAEQLGVHYMTAYRYVRTGRMIAEKHGGKWWVLPEDLAAVAAEGTGARRTTSRGSNERELLVDPFRRRLIAGDTAGCWDLISDALSSGAEPAEIHERLIGPALDEIGAGWVRGDYTVADEHRATATTTRLLGQMGPLFRTRGRRRGTVVLGAIARDPHSLPTAMMADLLSARRLSVIDLGANTPAESFIAVASRIDDLIGVGVSIGLDELVESAHVELQAIRNGLPDTTIVIGGGAVARTATDDAFGPCVDVISRSLDTACSAFEGESAAPSTASAN